MMVRKYRKKQVVVEAVQWDGGRHRTMFDFLTGTVDGHMTAEEDTFRIDHDKVKGGLVIKTLEGEMVAQVGDYIIRGVKGEYYPCKPDIFEMTYERCDEAEPVRVKDTHGGTGRGWIGVDLDGTLAEYHGWKGAKHIGKPIPKMVERVVGWLSDADGPDVRILTARVSPGKSDAEECRKYIERWLEEHIVSKLPVHLREPFPIAIPITHEKDHMMVELWDDRCVQVIPNTGERADGKA